MEEVIKQLALKYNMDVRVIKLICNHPLLFTKHIMEDPEDIRAVMIRYFGKFIFKLGKTVEEKKFNTEKHLARKSIALEA